MSFKTERQTLAETQKRKETRMTANKSSFNDLFNQTWEFFVVKLDKKTGKFVGKVACCAHAPV